MPKPIDPDILKKLAVEADAVRRKFLAEDWHSASLQPWELGETLDSDLVKNASVSATKKIEWPTSITVSGEGGLDEASMKRLIREALENNKPPEALKAATGTSAARKTLLEAQVETIKRELKHHQEMIDKRTADLVAAENELAEFEVREATAVLERAREQRLLDEKNPEAGTW